MRTNVLFANKILG